MSWCPKCGYEYRDGYTTCSDCGCELVEKLEKSNKKKMKYSKISIFIAVISFLTLLYCVPQVSYNSYSDTNAAKEVVKDYFKYFNNHDVKGVIKTLAGFLSDDSRGDISYDIKNTKFIKLLYIKNASNLISSYMKNGLGSIEKPYKARVFNITYFVWCKNGKILQDGVGLQSIHINVTKKTMSSPWKITSMGEG